MNRSTVGAIVRRQPFGGWKKSSVGAGAKAGGPNYLIGLCDWRAAPATKAGRITTTVQRFVDGTTQFGLSRADNEFLERSLRSDALCWAEEFGITRDVTGLEAEKNVLRYRPVPVTVRAEDGATAPLLRVVGAGLLAGSDVTVSTPEPLDPAVAELLRSQGIAYRIEGAEEWRKVLRDSAPGRVRLLGGSREEFAEASGGRADIALYAHPVVEAGRVELLTFLREQAVAVTAHRFGSPTPLVEGLFG